MNATRARRLSTGLKYLAETHRWKAWPKHQQPIYQPNLSIHHLRAFLRGYIGSIHSLDILWWYIGSIHSLNGYIFVVGLGVDVWGPNPIKPLLHHKALPHCRNIVFKNF
jgi:hypothetical protein